jgi:hypothetical protein
MPPQVKLVGSPKGVKRILEALADGGVRAARAAHVWQLTTMQGPMRDGRDRELGVTSPSVNNAALDHGIPPQF